MLALVVAGWLAVRDLPPTVTWLDIGSPGDDPLITGAFPPEQNLTESYRWTTSSAIVTVPAPHGSDYRLDISIASTGEEPRTLRITCPGDEIAVPLGAESTPPIVSLTCRSDGEIPVSISVPETRVPRDGRPLGIAIRDIRVTALGTELTTTWRLRVGLTVAATIVGIWLAAAALSGKRIATAIVMLSLVAALAISVRRPDWVGVAVAGPSGFVALAAGYAAWLLAVGRRTGPFALGLVSIAIWLLLPPADPARILPGLWTPHDATGNDLLPWLAALTIVAGSLLGGRRVATLAATATLTATASLLIPIVTRPLLERWSLVIMGPDWTDVASPVGGFLLVATAAVVLVAFYAQPRSPLPPRLALLTVVVLALAILVPWRNAVMDLNGDEPHYYVTAHSIADDADLELLDDYLAPEYLANTISPTGNIAVDRSTSPDRYVAFAPEFDDSRYLIPDETTGLSVLAPSGLQVDSANPPIVVDRDGDSEMLPALTAASTLFIPIGGPCHIESVMLDAPGDAPTTANIRLVDTTGAEIWHESAELTTDGGTIQPPLDSTLCASDFAGTLVVEADVDLVAQAIDTASGLRILPGRPAVTDSLLGPLPRDRFATQEATARFAIFNPGSAAVRATVTLLTPNDLLVRATDISLGPGATFVTDVDLHDGATIAVSATAPVAVSGVGWLPGGSYAIPSMPVVTSWTLDLPPAEDRDAGLWLALANPSPDSRTITIDHDGSSQTLNICPYCADMLHVSSDDQRQSVALSTANGPIAAAAAIYEERTGALHFDLGLPLMAALPVRIAETDAAPLVSAFATILLSCGLYVLLRRIGVNVPAAVWGAAAVALLAPLSPYAVRLYTEALAAAIIIWSLVCWDRARTRAGFAIAALLLAAALPIVHGRYTPIAILLASMAIVAGVRHARASLRHLIGLVAFAIVLIAVVAVSPFAVALRERASAGYFSTEWVPHSLAGILLDRGSGLLPFAPWCLIALAAGWRLQPLQRAAIVLFVTQLSIVALRAGGWQTFGAPARYILPTVPLLALLAVPGAIRLWRSPSGRVLVALTLGWSVVATLVLHWVPLTGYVYEGQYFIDDARRELPFLAPFDAFPAIAPAASSNLLGAALLLFIWTSIWVTIRQNRH